MSQKENAADRIRPFLKAMERSIRQARDERLTESAPKAPAAPTPAQRPAHHHQDALIGESRGMHDRPRTEADESTDNADRPARLKARPKRPSAFDDYRPQQTSRSEAV